MTAGWLLVLVILSSDAGVGIIGYMLFIYGALALGVWWLVLRLKAFGARQRDSGIVAPSWRHWGLVPSLLAAGVAVSVLEGNDNPFFLARFRMSEAALTREATRLLQTPSTEKRGKRRVGLFLVRRTAVTDNQVRFITASCGVIDSCGLVYSPVAQPRRMQEDSFAPLHGRWWHLHERF